MYKDSRKIFLNKKTKSKKKIVTLNEYLNIFCVKKKEKGLVEI